MPPQADLAADLDSAMPSGQTPVASTTTPQPQSQPQPQPEPEPEPDLTPTSKGSAIQDPGSALDDLFRKQTAEPEPEPKPEPEPAPESSKTPDDIETVQFPQNSSVKARESFDKLKQLSKERILAAEAKAKQTEEQLVQLKEKLSGQDPDQLKTKLEQMEVELTELREFRKTADVENAPEFKVYDQRVQKNDELIFAKLGEWGMTPEHLAKVKEIGTADLNWDPILSNLTPAQRRFIEAKLVDNVTAQEEKKSAVADAKQNADKFLSDREKKAKEDVQRAVQTRKSLAEKLANEAPWLKEPELPKDADEAARKQHEGARKFLNGIREKINIALEDTSPEMHATLAYGNAMSFYLSAQVDFLSKQAEQLKNSNEGLRGEITKLKRAASGKRPSDPSLEGGSRATRDVSEHRPGQRSEDALDTLWKQAQASQ